MDKILRVNLTDLTVKEEPFPQEWTFLGGRALSAKILLKEVDPKCDPLGPGNKVIFAPGVLSGSVAPDLRPHERRGQEPAYRRHQGSQLRRTGRAETRAARLSRPHRRGQSQRPGEALPRAVVTRRGSRSASARNSRGCAPMPPPRSSPASSPHAPPSSCAGRPASWASRGPASPSPTRATRHPSRHAARGGLGAAMGAKGLKADRGRRRRDAGARRRKDTAAFKAYVCQAQQGIQGRPAALPVRHLDHRAAGQYDEHVSDTEPA